MRKVFLDNLPMRGKLIDWKNCIGKQIKFIYDNIEGYITILNHLGNNTLEINYKDNIYKIQTNRLKRSDISNILAKEVYSIIYKNKNNYVDCTKIKSDGSGLRWDLSIGAICKFKYKNIESEFKVIGFEINKPKNRRITIEYNNNKYDITSSSIVNCRLGRITESITSEFKINIGSVLKDNKRNLIITDRKYIKDRRGQNRKWYNYICNNCGWDNGIIEEPDLLRGHGCACCSGQTVIENINSIVATEPWMIKYFQGGYDEAKLYTKQSPRRIFPVCPNCGRVKERSIQVRKIYKNHSIGCICNKKTPYSEKIMYSVLEQLNVDFVTQYNSTFSKWCEDKRYDFYFKKDGQDYIIETNGIQHYNGSFKNLGGNTLQEENENDKYKKELAIHNGIKEENYIIIDCRYSNIEWCKDSIINSRLNEIFDLSIIDWNKCEELGRLRN